MIGLPLVSRATWTLNFAALPRLLAQLPALTPRTSALGQRSIRAAAGWVSPFGSLNVTSASICAGRVDFGKSFSANVAKPLRSVVRASLSAISLPSRLLASRSLSSLSGASLSALLRVARRVEAELVVAGEGRRARPQQRRRPQGRRRHRPAGEVAHLHADGDARRRDLRCFRPADARVDQRQAEFLDAEVAARPAVLAAAFVALARARAAGRRIALEDDVVDAELGGGRDVPGRQRAAAGTVPSDGHDDLLAAALVDDLDARRQPVGGERRQAARGLDADEVLHRHRLAGAKERAVEDRRGAQVGLGAAAGRHVEAPRLDPLLPAAEDEGDVGDAFRIGLARADEVAAVGDAVLGVRRRARWPMTASPLASLVPCQSGLPLQSLTTTSAPAAGLPRSSVVTQTTLFSRPCLKWPPRLVTRMPVRTNIGARLSSSDWPRRSDSISTT